MMSQTSKRELLKAVRPRYTLGNRTAKQQILDEFVAATGYHRKYAIHLLNHPPKRGAVARRARGAKYGGRVRAALERVWRVANCICGKRLVAVLPQYVAALERHGELDLDADTGGYNLQAAFSTGYIAGEEAAAVVQGFAEKS